VLTTVAGEPQGNLLTIGLAYSFGIAFALIVCATASGGIFHPGVLIAQVIFKVRAHAHRPLRTHTCAPPAAFC
jgi:hypothetical protein